MAKKPKGLLSGRKLSKRRKRFRYNKKGFNVWRSGVWRKFDPLKGAPQARGIVLEKVNREPKKPNSALRKCARVQLVKNAKVVTAFLPGVDAIKHVDEHNEVIIERVGGAQRGARGDLPGVKFRVIKVNGVDLQQIIAGKKEKPVR
jgi:small subunit ribosomal protein S12